MDAGIGPDRSAGFSLIELMVVVAILSVLTLTAVMGVNRPRSDGSDWARFERIHDRLREQAVLGQAVLGLRLGPDSYRRLRRTGTGWVEEGPAVDWLRPVRVTEDIVAFLPGGQSTPVRLAFSEAAGGETICDSDGWTPVTCAAR